MATTHIITTFIFNIIMILVFIVLCYLVGRFWESKGRSYLNGFGLSVVLGPLVRLLAVFRFLGVFGFFLGPLVGFLIGLALKRVAKKGSNGTDPAG